MKNKLQKAFDILRKYIGISIMAYAVLCWLYWQFFANTLSTNPTRELLGGLAFFSKAGIKYILTNTFYLLIGGVGYVIYKSSNHEK